MPLDAAQMIFGTPEVSSDNPHKPSSIVGSGNVWTDTESLSSETYTETWLSARPGPGNVIGDAATATVGAIAVPSSATTLFMLVSIRLQLMNELNAASENILARFSFPGSNEGVNLAGPGGGYPTAPVDEWTTLFGEFHPLPGYPGAAEVLDSNSGELATIDHVRSLFAEGCELVLTRISGEEVGSRDFGIRVSEVIGSLWWITSNTRQRLNQRDDRNGRRGTSRQNSNRLTGYR